MPNALMLRARQLAFRAVKAAPMALPASTVPKATLRAELDAAVANFLARGGAVTIGKPSTREGSKR